MSKGPEESRTLVRHLRGRGAVRSPPCCSGGIACCVPKCSAAWAPCCWCSTNRTRTAEVAEQRHWWMFSLALGRVMAKFWLTLLFVVVLTPVSLIWRLIGRDPLARRRDKWPGWSAYPGATGTGSITTRCIDVHCRLEHRSVAAVLWPGRLTGPLDGAPFDAVPEALLLAVALPALWFLAPLFLKTRTARSLMGGLLVWKIAGWLLLTQTGWCATFLASPQADAPMQAQPSWDVRTLWAPRAGCSAILTRAARSSKSFRPGRSTSCPSPRVRLGGAFELRAAGVVVTRANAQLKISGGAGARPAGEIDGREIGPADWPVALSPGVHRVTISVALRGTSWRFVPMLGDRVLFDSAETFVSPPSALDRALRGWARCHASRTGHPSRHDVDGVRLPRHYNRPRHCSPGPARRPWPRLRWVRSSNRRQCGSACLVSCRRSSCRRRTGARTLRHAFLLVGLPWLAFWAGRSVHDVGRFMVYTSGDDWWTFQRHAYEIFMQGAWLEGGEKTFWNQPLYRWTAGVLHLIFGDSSVGSSTWTPPASPSARCSRSTSSSGGRVFAWACWRPRSW